MSVAEELEKLNKLKQDGAISEEEFNKTKSELLAQNQTAPADVQKSGVDVKQWTMFIHLSQLLSFLIPFAGLIVPIVLWQTKKEESEEIDRHGKIVANWIISAVIYGIGGTLLSFILIGIPILIALGIVCIVFPIIGGIKANNGEEWQYPISLKLIK